MESVPPRLYGGTERIVSYLTEELVRQDHEVTLFASGDSVTSAELAPCTMTALRLDPGYVLAFRGRGHAYHVTGAYAKAVADYTEVLRRTPQDVSAYRSRAGALVSLGDLDVQGRPQSRQTTRGEAQILSTALPAIGIVNQRSQRGD